MITFTLGAAGQRLILEPSVIDHLEAHRQLSPRDVEDSIAGWAVFIGTPKRRAAV